MADFVDEGLLRGSAPCSRASQLRIAPHTQRTHKDPFLLDRSTLYARRILRLGGLNRVREKAVPLDCCHRNNG
jgi:hypothetical protein